MKLNQKGAIDMMLAITVAVVVVVGAVILVRINDSDLSISPEQDQTTSTDQSGDKETRDAETSDDEVLVGFATGIAELNRQGNVAVSIKFNNSLLDENFSEVWVEYGEDPSASTLRTESTAEYLNNNATTYTTVYAFLDNKFLEPNKTYFYRAVGKKADGTLVKAGIAAFDLSDYSAN